MARESRRCAVAGCRAWALRGELFCRAHRKLGAVAEAGQMATAGAETAPPPVDNDSELPAFYARVFSADELAEIARQLKSPERSTEMEVAIMRVMIRRVMERSGETDPLKALPLVRQGVDAICRALRTERLLTGESADSLAAAMAVALREVGEELGISEQ